MGEKNWKLKLKYGESKTPYIHFTTLADGFVGELTKGFECQKEGCIVAILLSIISVLLSLVFLLYGIPYFFWDTTIWFCIFGAIFVLQASISLYCLIKAWRRKGVGQNNILKYSSLIFLAIFIAFSFTEILLFLEFKSIILISIILLVNWLCVRKVSSLRLNT